MADNLNIVWDKFFQHRTRTLWERFPGCYRSLVVETNDPLDMYRIRFKCPDLHDFSLPPSDCPWAVPAFDLGGLRAGRFSHPCIGDWVWITFERQHPYGPVWTGFAQPTRRKLYSYPSVFQVTPLPVNEDGKPIDRPKDYDKRYLAKDGRPMQHGWVDRYGNMDIQSSVGFYPEEHKAAPPPPDHDAVQGSSFKQQTTPPEVNSPDKKYMARVTKYGQMLMLSDQGYYWKKENGLGEFEGSFKRDEDFEIKRWLILQRLLNEDEPGGDHRRIMLMNRYGSRFELRDTGWAQQGPIPSHSRPDEFGPPSTLSQETTNDYRWAKIRTKGGMLWQAYDKGCHPANDTFIKRPLVDELGARSERENVHWKDKDARQIRSVTRYGLKIVQDDRGTDVTDADTKELPRANGILIKGRRSPGAKTDPAAGSPKGFYWEFNENDEANHTSWGSPLGQVVELNDRYQYLMMAVSMGPNWAANWKGLAENEFIRKPTMLHNPERSAYHLKLDHDNEYLRLKTRGGQGPTALQAANPSGVQDGEIQQGLEARDGSLGRGPWVEIVDCQRRGLWLSTREQLGIWRASIHHKMYQWFDEQQKRIVIYNNEAKGTIEIFANSKVNIISTTDINLSADGDINMFSAGTIKMQAGATKATFDDNGISINTDYHGRKVFAATAKPQPGGTKVDRIIKPTIPDIIEPDDRAQTYNDPFVECPIAEVEHPLQT